jgi:hypothetical protein
MTDTELGHIEKWKRVDAERYYDMLGIVPPALQHGNGFLVGEAYDHRTCRVSGRIEPTYMGFVYEGERGDEDFYEAEQPMTVGEFCASGMVKP